MDNSPTHVGRNVVFLVIVPLGALLYLHAMRHDPQICVRLDTPRRITMLAYNGSEILDITGPLDVFAIANSIHLDAGGQLPLYQLEIAGEAKDVVLVTSSGIRLLADTSWVECSGADTLLVAGGLARQAPEELVNCLRHAAPSSRRVGSICTGAFILARAGLLEGRRATTHWLLAEQLRKQYPRIDVQGDALHIKDGSVYTSAGVTAGIDLALALLEEDQGRTMALNVARLLVLYLKRPGGQSQFSTALLTQFQDGGVLAPTIHWMRENFHRDLCNEVLAEHASMSLRNFARVFKRETGTTPAHFLERIRLEAAVKRLEETGLALETIARECGFQSAEHFRLAFVRGFGISPAQYRDRFRPGAGQ
ncbi:GlxA family transcriptional regulator [Desulfovibrio sp. JY]|nr:GlxA family transcriptional regulator [Desulfovibrio sp. JY]